MSIHPTAIVDAAAEIEPSATIGPYCVVTGEVRIGADTLVESHARIGSRYGRVTIGAHNHIQHGAVLGGPPQDLGYENGGYTALEIGSHNRLGEFVSIHLGTSKGGGVTRVGDHNFIMAYTHIGHDGTLADHIVLTNSVQIAGHVTIEERAIVSGMAGITQFVRIGAYSFLAAGAFANKDITPYTVAEGHWATPRAVNRVGLKRAGFSAEERRNIERAVRFVLDRKLTMDDAVAAIRAQCASTAPIEHLLNFIAASKRGIARG